MAAVEKQLTLALALRRTQVVQLNGLKPVCAGLFSHSDQTEAAQTLKCQIRGSAPKGVGGRMADALSAGTQQFRTASYSLSGRQTWAQGVDINQTLGEHVL